MKELKRYQEQAIKVLELTGLVEVDIKLSDYQMIAELFHIHLLSLGYSAV